MMYVFYYHLLSKVGLGIMFYLSVIILTDYCWVCVMKNYSEFFGIYHMYYVMVKTQHNIIVKYLCCDLDVEYTSNNFFELLYYDDIIHQTSSANTLNKMVFLKENIVTSLKLLVPFCCLLRFLESFEVK